MFQRNISTHNRGKNKRQKKKEKKIFEKEHYGKTVWKFQIG
jgi:hypothetical protein